MFKRRRKAVLVAFALAVVSGFTFASQAGATATPTQNACSNNIDTNLREIDGTQNGTSPATVAPGAAFTLTGISVDGTVPPAVFVAGYNLGLINNGDTVPGNAREQIEGTNTVQGIQQTATVPIAVGPVVIHDPDGVRGSGDESADPAPFHADFPDMNWTAGASGTIQFREDTVLPFPPAPGTGGLLVHAIVGGGLITAEFRCDPGTVTGPDPGTPTIQDPGPTFSSTQIQGPPSNISINDVSMAEGNSGTTAFNFTVSMDAAQAAPVTVDFATADGTATAPSDYTAGSGTLTFAPGETSKTVTVQVNGDTAVEPDETFNVNLSNATGNATISDNLGVGTIQNDDQPAISIDNQTVTEGGTANFTVSLDQASNQTVTVDFATANNTAQAPGDYTASSGTLTFAPGVTSQTVSVPTVDDSLVEGTETFAVNLSNATNATITDAIGVGTILDNDAAGSNITINDVSANEGNSGTTAFDFTVSLSAAQATPVTVDFATADGTATLADNDYVANSGTLTFAPGVTTQTVSVQVNGDTTFEPNETFFVNLSNATGNATIADNQGLGTIVNDDAAPPVIDASGNVIVNGPVSHTKSSKSFVFKVTNLGNAPLTINPADVTAGVSVNGTETDNVSVSGLPVTLGPGASKRLKLVWSYDSTLTGGEALVFHACVQVSGDSDTTNDCDSASATAK